MKKTVVLRIVIWGVVLVLLLAIDAWAQITLDYSQHNRLIASKWDAHWIQHPHAPPTGYGVYLLRHTFRLDQVPKQLMVHCSGDNRYRLYVNEKEVAEGPARSDLNHYNYETIDLSPYLKTGKNLLAVRLVNYGAGRPLAQVTYQTGFLLQADLPTYDHLNTGTGNWKITTANAWSAIPINSKTAHGYYVAGPGDRFHVKKHQYGWLETKYNDNDWLTPKKSGQATSKGFRWVGQRILVPRTIPAMEKKQERFAKIVRCRGQAAKNDFIKGDGTTEIKPERTVTMLLDFGHLTIGYPKIVFSKGTDAQIKITYGEATFDANGQKTHRNVTDGEQVEGVYDEIFPDGLAYRNFSPLWLRTFRYVQLDITTRGEPLLLHDFYNEFTAYPFDQVASFETNNRNLKPLWDISWRTARLCAGENYFDCPYYEQLQYVGDTRLQALISLYVTGDDRLARKAITDIFNSLQPEGLTHSRYPSSQLQIIPSFSLFWVNMLHDYHMLSPDTAFVKNYLGGARRVLDWFAQQLRPDSLLGPITWWPFLDWANDFKHGTPPGTDQGGSAAYTLLFSYTLQNMAQLEKYFGNPTLANNYLQMANNINQAVNKLCTGNGGRIADTPEKKTYSQQTNALAVLANAIPTEIAPKVIKSVAFDQSITPASLYFTFYLTRALEKTGQAELYFDILKPWYKAIDMGLTTFPEDLLDMRSDCHAWSATPMYEFLHTVCGIKPAAPGFSQIKIEPAPGSLENITARMPHPNGFIKMELEFKGFTYFAGTITLPPRTNGVFAYKNARIALSPGLNVVTAD